MVEVKRLGKNYIYIHSYNKLKYEEKLESYKNSDFKVVKRSNEHGLYTAVLERI